jgi:hypothetical protein
MESGIPVSAGIPEGDEQFIDPQEVQVIPYLSHGILTEADAQAAAAEAIHDPSVLGESVKSAPLNRVERALQGNPQVIPYLSHGVLTESDAQALAAEAIADPNLTRLDDRQVPVDGDQVAMANALESQRFVPGVTDFPTTPRVDTPAVRPDDLANRFAHSDVPAQSEGTSSSSGSTVEWNEALTAGIAALVLGLGLGLAFGRLTRPKLAGL